MRDFFSFLRAVWRHWEPLLTGGTVMAVLFLIQYLGKIAISERVYWSASIFTLLLAFFFAWREQHTLAETIRGEHQKQIEKLTSKLNSLQQQLDEKPLTKIQLHDALIELMEEGKNIVGHWAKSPCNPPLAETDAWFSKTTLFCKKHLGFDDFKIVENFPATAASMIGKTIEAFQNEFPDKEHFDKLRLLFSRLEALEDAIPKPQKRVSQRFRGGLL